WLHPKAVYGGGVPSSHRGIPARDDRKEPTRSRLLIIGLDGADAAPRVQSGAEAHHDLVEPPRAPDLAPKRERLPELDPDLRPSSALQRVCSITRMMRLMRSQGCQGRASVSFTSPSARAGPRGGEPRSTASRTRA